MYLTSTEVLRRDPLNIVSAQRTHRIPRRVTFDTDLRAVETTVKPSLDDLHAELVNDDGTSSFANYKSPIF